MKAGEKERERGGPNTGDRVVIAQAADGFNSCIILCVFYWIRLQSFTRHTLIDIPIKDILWQICRGREVGNMEGGRGKGCLEKASI